MPAKPLTQPIANTSAESERVVEDGTLLKLDTDKTRTEHLACSDTKRCYAGTYPNGNNHDSKSQSKQDKDKSSQHKAQDRLANYDLRQYYAQRLVAAQGITFDPQSGNITIPEKLAELGSRIYVDVGYARNNQQEGSWDVDTQMTQSDPLALDISWPQGFVQANPFALSRVESRALTMWIKHDPKNKRLFVDRNEEIGVEGDPRGQQDQYSCVGEDTQHKLCMSITPERSLNNTEKQLSIVKLEAQEHTILDPVKRKVTRFVDIRKDYDWKFKRTQLPDRTSDPGFQWYGDMKQGTEYLVYRWNINTGKTMNLNMLVDLIEGRPRHQDSRFPQPSLRPFNTNDPDSINKHMFENAWGSYVDLPQRGDGISYAFRDESCKAKDTSAGNCQWVNILDLVKYHRTTVDMQFEGGAVVNTNDSLNETNSSVHKDFIMPGGDFYNGQAANEDVGTVITDKKDVESIKDYEQPFHAQLYVNNGNIIKDLQVRNQGNQDVSHNVLNVWFLPVDVHKPVITAKKYGPGNIPWNIHGNCMMQNAHNPSECALRNGDVIDLEAGAAPWYSTDAGTMRLPENLKLSDDFNNSEAQGLGNNATLLNSLWIDIIAQGMHDKNGKTPRLRFVYDGQIDTDFLRRFIEHYRGSDPQHATVFKMVAQIQDASGNKSDETAVGCFTTKWTNLNKPAVVAYDSLDHPNRVSLGSEFVWLHQASNAETAVNGLNNDVMVRPDPNADRMVVNFQKRSELINDDNSSTGVLPGMGTTLAICKVGRRWWLCGGYSASDLGIDSWYNLTHQLNKNKHRHQGYIWRSDGEIYFPKNWLAYGSVVRARNRKGNGPWTDMPGVQSYEDLEADRLRNSVRGLDNAKHRSARKLTDKRVRAANDPKLEDLRDVSPIDYAKDDPERVCRPDDVTPKTWEDNHHGSDCVYFGVAMKRRIVQVHPMLLSNDEKHAITMELRKENAWRGLWIENHVETAIDETPTLSPEQAMITWRQLDYSRTEDKRRRHPKLPEYGGIAGNIQDVPVLTRGWRSRYLIPLPRERQITRFARIRAGKNIDNKDGSHPGDQNGELESADYNVTWDRAHNHISSRPDDPGLSLSRDGKSIIYRYDLATKQPFTVNDVQALLQFKVNKTLHPDNECGKYIDHSEWKFKDCQPSLRTVRGDDKINGEISRQVIEKVGAWQDTEIIKKSGKIIRKQWVITSQPKTVYGRRGFKMLDTHFYIYMPGVALHSAALTARAASSSKLKSAEDVIDNAPYFVNIVDALYNRSGGGFSRVEPFGQNAQETGKHPQPFKGISSWGRSAEVKASEISDHDSKPAMILGDGPAARLLVMLGSGWVDDSLTKVHGMTRSDEHESEHASLMNLYLIAVDGGKPIIDSRDLGKVGKSARHPYGIDIRTDTFTVMGKPDSRDKVDGKSMLIDIHDNYDTLQTTADRSKVCVQRVDVNGNPQGSCTSIIRKNDKGLQDVDMGILQQLVQENGKNAVYRVLAAADDESGNKSEGYDDNGGLGRVLGYLSLNGILVKPVPMPFTGGLAAILFSLLCVLFFLVFIAMEGFKRKGWIRSWMALAPCNGKHQAACNESMIASVKRCKLIRLTLGKLAQVVSMIKTHIRQ